MDLKNIFSRRQKPDDLPTSEPELAPAEAAKPPAPPAPVETAPAVYPGSTLETAIVVGSVHDEYEWMKQNYPGYGPISQKLIDVRGRPYAVMTWSNDSADRVTIHFDISSFFRKRPQN